jgi:linoleoyl-CoA desaturase
LSTVKGNIKFRGEDQQEFFRVLKSRVDDYFRENHISKYANLEMVVKTIVFLSLYFLPMLAMLVWNFPTLVQLLLWGLTGLGLAGIGMSVMHDANHGAYSAKKWVNTLMGYTLNLVGGSVFNWKLQHNILHHTYTNISRYDEDIDDKLILRMSPHTNVKGVHRFQIVYAFLFYGILTLYWALAKDLIQFRRYCKNGVNPLSGRESNMALLKIIAVKIFYFLYTLVIPIWYFQAPAGAWIGGFLFGHMVAGMVLTVIFQLAHTVEGTAHPLPDQQGNIENSWAVHQLCTTVNFARNNRLLSFYIGGLNFQVEHHLFPKICHVHYPKLAPIVERTAREYGIPYMENRTFMEAFMSHVRTLQRFGVASVEFG